MVFEAWQSGGGRVQGKVGDPVQNLHLVVVTCAEADGVVEDLAYLVTFRIETQVVDRQHLFSQSTAQQDQNLLVGGVGGEVAAMIGEQAFEYLDGPVTRLAGPDVPATAIVSEQDDKDDEPNGDPIDDERDPDVANLEAAIEEEANADEESVEGAEE